MENHHLCSKCGSVYGDEAKLKKHISQVHDTHPRSCKICSVVSIGNVKFAVHMKSHRTSTCEKCSKEIPTNSLTNHRLKCTGEKLKCESCSYDTFRRDHLKKHRKIHEKNIDKNEKQATSHECTFCGKVFGKKSNLQRHISVHTGYKKIPCEECGAVLSDKDKLDGHMKTQHVNKVIKTGIGFGVWNDKEKIDFQCKVCDYKTNRSANLDRHTQTQHVNEKKEKLLKCDKCDFTSEYNYNIRKHMKTVKHVKEPSRSTKYRNLSTLKETLNCRIKAKEDPEKVFGEIEVIKLIEDCNGSTRDLLKMIKWMRSCFGKNHFSPNIRKLIQDHMNKLEHLHEAEVETFKDKDGNDKESVLSRIADLNSFIDEIKTARNLIKPKLILGADGSVDKCVVTGIIMEEHENHDDEEIHQRFRATGQKRVFLLAQADGVPENKHNMEILLDSLNLPLISQDYQTVCDLKLINILLGLQTCTAMFGCPYCESCKLDSNGKRTNKRGKYMPIAKMRTNNNISENNDEYLKNGKGKREYLQNYKNCEFKPVKLKNGNGEREVILDFPPDPLHVNILGSPIDALDILEELHPVEMKEFYQKLSLKKSGTGPGGKFNGPCVKSIIKEENLQLLATMIPADKEPFVHFLRSVRELHSHCVSSEFKPKNTSLVLFNFETNFDYLYDNFRLNQTLKVHVILHHYAWYFNKTGKNFKNTNGEYVEAVHSSLKKHERDHGFVVKKRQGTPQHRQKSLQSHVTYNSMRIGATSPMEFTLRKKSKSPPSSTPRLKKTWNFKKSQA